MEKKDSSLSLIKLLAQKKYLLLISCMFSVLHAFLNLSPYVLIYEVLFQIINKEFDLNILQTYTLYCFALMLLSYLCLYISLVLSHIAAFSIIYEFRINMAKKISNLSLGFLENNSKGVLKKVLIDDIERFEGFIAHNIPDLIKAILMPVFVLIFMFILDYRLAFASLFPLILFIIWLVFMMSNSSIQKASKKYYDSSEKMNAVISEYVKSINIMKVFNQETKNFENYNNSVNFYTKHISSYIKKNTPFYAILISFISNALFPIMFIGTYLLFDGKISFSILILFLILGVAYLKPILVLSTLSNKIYSVLESFKRVDNIINKKNQLRSNLSKTKLENYDIEYKNLSFSYDQKEVLTNINLKIPQGEITAFIGASGAGKSTACELLARFYDFTKGDILIGSKSIKDINFNELMSNISYVFQDNFMFNESFYENISMGSNASHDEIIKACKIAQADEFISSFENKYESIYGKDIISLSAGQKQRIQLARIVLKNSPIFIFDEATSFCDAKNEYEIQNAINKIIKNKTVIIIAHRLSTIKHVDNIILFDKGKILSQGKHENLIKSCETYQKMWSDYEKIKDYEIKGENNVSI